MPAVHFSLKHYQKQALEQLRTYLAGCSTEGPNDAFYKQTRRPYTEAPEIDKDVPYVCLRVPTGGGKTIMAAHAIGIAADEFLKADAAIVLWLVPSEAIRDQTLSALKDLEHPYRAALIRDFGHAVKVMTKDEALSLTPADANGNVCIIVSTIQSFRRTKEDGSDDPEGLKVYEPAGALMPHFSGLTERQKQCMEPIPGSNQPKTSLVNLIKLHHPVVIVDEAHNARTDLSFKTLARLNPSLILEMTATPRLPEHGRDPSNILHSVSAAELKAEEMIKLPIQLTTNADWQQTVGAALDCQIELEKLAKEEQQQTGEYIRPIILFQAQAQRGTDPISFATLTDFLLQDKKIPKEQITVHTGPHNELDGIEINNPNCLVRYVITVQKLKEGWDCPFAYILCSVADQRSTTAVEQILGRVLRMPKAKRKKNKALNKAYAFVASANFDQTASRLRDSLVDGAGFEKIEADQMVNRSPDLFTGGTAQTATPSLFAQPTPKDPFVVPLLAITIQGKLELFRREHFLNLPWPLEDCEAKDIMTHLHIRDDTKKGQIDTTEHGKVIIDSVRRLQEDLSAIIYEPEWTEARLVNWLDSGGQQDVTKPSSILFISKVLEVLKAEDYSLDELARHKYQLRDAIRRYISVLRKDRQDGSYNALFATYANRFALSSDYTIIFDEERYAYNQPYRGPRRFNKHYTEIIGDLEASGEEFDCACYIDNLKEVKHWIRNTDKKPYSFWLQLPHQKFYPDFVAQLHDGRILVVEYKGSHLYTDAESKRRIGEVWAEASNGQCLFCMPTNREFRTIDPTIADAGGRT